MHMLAPRPIEHTWQSIGGACGHSKHMYNEYTFQAHISRVHIPSTCITSTHSKHMYHKYTFQAHVSRVHIPSTWITSTHSKHMDHEYTFQGHSCTGCKLPQLLPVHGNGG